MAVIFLTRPAYRLGELISATVAFHASRLSCHSLRATLESFENIDPSISLRSKTSIHRVTRRAHISHSESTLFSRRVSFDFLIPINATPSFATSGVTLEWNLRFEFVISRVEQSEGYKHGLLFLNELSQDDRGFVAAAIENLLSETFDVTIPITIYGVTPKYSESFKL